MNNILDISPLEKAVKSLEKALIKLDQMNNSPNIEEDEKAFIKDSVIQRFEYTYELCPKFFKRYLKEAAADQQEASELDYEPFQVLVRTANMTGMFKNDWEKWKIYRNARNITSHTYNEEKADEVTATAKEFYSEALYFLNRLKENLNKMS